MASMLGSWLPIGFPASCADEEVNSLIGSSEDPNQRSSMRSALNWQLAQQAMPAIPEAAARSPMAIVHQLHKKLVVLQQRWAVLEESKATVIKIEDEVADLEHGPQCC